MEEIDIAVEKTTTSDRSDDGSGIGYRQSPKEKRREQRRKIEEVLEARRLKAYTETYDYYFGDEDA